MKAADALLGWKIDEYVWQVEKMSQKILKKLINNGLKSKLN